jgi:hypothetical protein
MEFRVGSLEEQVFLQSLIEKQIIRNENEENINNLKITDIEEYKYLQHLVLKYCRISNAAL